MCEECDCSASSVATGTLPIAKSQAGREHAEGLGARARERRVERMEQKAAAERAALLKRCQQSTSFWCRCDPDGDPDCNFTFRSEKHLRQHIAADKHRSGLLRPWKTGVAAGRGTSRDRDVKLVAQALIGVKRVSGGQAPAEMPLCLKAEFKLTFGDGVAYEVPPAPLGWARSQRLPAVRSTPEQQPC